MASYTIWHRWWRVPSGVVWLHDSIGQGSSCDLSQTIHPIHIWSNDRCPSFHPDTIVTTLNYCKNYLQSSSMNTVHITLDMQLYMVAIQVKWSDPEKWATLVMHPGRMHCLMSFLGCISKLMRGSGLEELIGAAFSGLTGILNGKNWPRAMRALCMVCTVLLSDFLYKEGSIPTFEDLFIFLEKACKTPTGQLWVDCLIRPTLIAHMFIRAQRHGDWLLHVHCLQNMLPYFFAAGHWHYAWHITWYLQEMSCLPEDLKSDLMAGAFVCRHREGVWNSVSADQFWGHKLIYAMANLKVVSLASASQLSRLHAGFSLILCVSVCLRPSSWCLNLLTVNVQHWLRLLNTKRRDLRGESW